MNLDYMETQAEIELRLIRECHTEISSQLKEITKQLQILNDELKIMNEAIKSYQNSKTSIGFTDYNAEWWHQVRTYMWMLPICILRYNTLKMLFFMLALYLSSQKTAITWYHPQGFLKIVRWTHANCSNSSFDWRSSSNSNFNVSSAFLRSVISLKITANFPFSGLNTKISKYLFTTWQKFQNMLTCLRVPLRHTFR